MIFKVFSIIICNIFSVFYVLGNYVAEVRLEKKDYKIRGCNNVVIGNFEVEADKNAIRNDNGEVSFCAKIKRIGFHKKNYFNNHEKIYLDNKELELDNDGRFIVLIPEERLSNETFKYKIQFVTLDPNVNFESIKFEISPLVMLEADRKKVNLGKIIQNADKIVTAKQEVKIKYTILKNAQCLISSRNNFRLKHKRINQYIPYHVEIEHMQIEDIDKATKAININTKNNEFIIKVYVEEYRTNLPKSGKYTDELVIELMPNG